MDNKFYLDKFRQAADLLDKKLLAKKQIEVAVGIYLDSVFLKLYKRSWANDSPDPVTAESRIFFSIWINDTAIKEKKILYNIHALKLRKLKGYSIESRKFADAFRTRFKSLAHKWQNISLTFGPLTLMEGWLTVDLENFQDEVLELCNKFLDTAHLIDDTLIQFKK